MKNFLFGAGALAALLSPAAAHAAEGFATANVNMRSGPSTYYPAVTIIPIGESIEIHGCLAEVAWCDVSFFGGRGWVSGLYVQAAYDDDRVYLEPRYYRPLGIPTITFEFGNYWDRYYRGRDFYREREYWRRGPGYARDNDRYERRRRGSSQFERGDDDDFEFESGNRRARERAERLERERAQERQLQRSERRQRERAERRNEAERERMQLERQRDRDNDRAERRRRDRDEGSAERSRQRDDSRSERRRDNNEQRGGDDNRGRRRCVEGQPLCD